LTTENYRLGKGYMLSSKTEIDALFNDGHTFKSYPFIVTCKKASFGENQNFKFVISAPKRIFKHAHQRNRAKRICKEAIRLNKGQLEEQLNSMNIQIALFIVYTAKEEPSFGVLQNKTIKLFKKIITHFEQHEQV